jgi:hypothetical protein
VIKAIADGIDAGKQRVTPNEMAGAKRNGRQQQPQQDEAPAEPEATAEPAAEPAPEPAVEETTTPSEEESA